MSSRGGLADGGVGDPPAALARLCALLRDEGGLIAALVDDDGCVAAQDGATRRERIVAVADASETEIIASPASIAAQGPRAEDRRDEYELVVEAIYEGYLLHYGAPRVVCTQEADLRVLAGDRLYAIGLARLVGLGDTFAVAELADTIALSALAQGAGDVQLADAVWAAGARAVGWGPSDAHSRAKDLVAGGSPQAIEAMRTSVLATPGTP
jgi:hypothetical protein